MSQGAEPGRFGEGAIRPLLVRFALPLLLSNFLQALYNMADMLIVGLYCGPSGLSAVSIGGQVTMLVTGAVVGLAVGGMVLIAQYHGARRPEDEAETIGTMLGLYFSIAAVSTLAMTLLSNPILRLLNTPAESFAQAGSYLRICMGGTVFIFGYNAMSSILYGLGDSRRPLLFIAAATMTNVVLDILFVGPLKLGAAGAAWATIMSQALSLALSTAYLRRRGFAFDFKPSSFRVRADKAAKLIRIGLPASLQQVIVQLSFIFLLALVNSFGLASSAAAGICSKVNSFAILPGIAMLSAVSSMAGQNIGAGLYDRALATEREGRKLILPVAIAIFACVNAFTRPILSVFSSDPEVLAIGERYLRFLSVDALIVTNVFCLNGLITGAGKTFVTLINTCVSSILIRIPLAYLLAKGLGMGMTGVGLAAAASPLGALACSAYYVRSGRWRKGAIAR